ncbi:MAG: rod shape-determining protein RodA [Candidatus Obscuribacterales bacterium]|nr:rod shape-determining protein RodA [Candidatus Obscuribacterales bacterium]
MIGDSRNFAASNMMRNIFRLIAGVDWLLLAATFFLLGVGLTVLAHEGSGYATKQRDFLFAGTAALLFFWRVPYIFWTSKVVLPALNVINIILLIAVMIAGHSALGAQRWLALGPITIQPSEIAKLVVIFTLSWWLAFKPILRFWDCLYTIGIILIPAILVFKQPDLGTSLTFGAVYFGMCFWAGAGITDIIVLTSPLFSLICNALDFNLWLIFLALLGSGLIIFWRTRSWSLWMRFVMVLLVLALNFGAGVARPHLWGVLKEYQQKRLTSFVNPYADPRGSGYHILQSLIAVGSGGVNGAGLGKGNQSQGAFIPERHTDFIFAVIGEELGFRLSAAIIAAYALICTRAIIIAYRSREQPRGSLMAIGIMCMFLFHVFLNIGMTIGIMPVAGVPLPFLSYGGTALIIDLSAIGLLMSISTMNPARKKEDNW